MRNYGLAVAHGMQQNICTAQDGDSDLQTQWGWEAWLMDVLRSLGVGCAMFWHSLMFLCHRFFDAWRKSKPIWHPQHEPSRWEAVHGDELA